MKTHSIDPLLETQDINTIEIKIGLEQGEPIKRLDRFMGEDGIIYNEDGFDIYTVRLTQECLVDLINANPTYVEYIEHIGDGIVPIYDTINVPLETK